MTFLQYTSFSIVCPSWEDTRKGGCPLYDPCTVDKMRGMLWTSFVIEKCYSVVSLCMYPSSRNYERKVEISLGKLMVAFHHKLVSFFLSLVLEFFYVIYLVFWILLNNPVDRSGIRGNMKMFSSHYLLSTSGISPEWVILI